jgi:hypothetical protein
MNLDNLEAEFAFIHSRAEHVLAIRYAQSRGARLEAIRAFYIAAWKEIKTHPAHVWALDPYEVDWPSLFTPIEYALWSQIRAEGIVLYPQHPVAGYFVDFGHPLARVAVECDGAAFHTDKAKDMVRQRAIEAKGWRVYRLTGKACMRDFTEEENEETGAIRLIPSPARVLLREVAERHGLSAKALRRAA